MRLRREIVLFAVGGLLGLLVDASIVQRLVGVLHWNLYAARVVSFLCAASLTWWWNSRHTFAHRMSGRAAHAEWVHWLGLMGFGAVINYGVYVCLLLLFPALHPWPALPAAGGSVVAAGVNFSIARRVLFPGRKTPS